MVNGKRIGKAIGLFILVTLPTLFTLLWTLEAALVPGADVFIIAAIQLIFFTIYFGYRYRQGPVGQPDRAQGASK